MQVMMMKEITYKGYQDKVETRKVGASYRVFDAFRNRVVTAVLSSIAHSNGNGWQLTYRAKGAVVSSPTISSAETISTSA